MPVFPGKIAGQIFVGVDAVFRVLLEWKLPLRAALAVGRTHQDAGLSTFAAACHSIDLIGVAAVPFFGELCLRARMDAGRPRQAAAAAGLADQQVGHALRRDFSRHHALRGAGLA